MARDVLLDYPDCNEELKIHTDASGVQLVEVIIRNVKPFSFYSRKLTGYKISYTVTKK